jgi:ABC-type glycerol-3-phosphate transport system permease component
MKPKHKINVRSVIAHIVLILLSFLCLFFFVILIINATRSHAQLQKGFSFIPGGHFLDNLKSVANDGSFPMFRGIVNSLIISGSSAVLCTYFSSLTAYGLYAYDFKLKKAAFTFIMAILVMPTQVTAMGFLRLITNMGMYDSWAPLIIPSIASPAVFYFMYSYLQSSLPLSLVEAARIDGSNEFKTFNHIVLPIMKPAIAVQAIFTFVGSWNNYFTPALIIQSKNKMTVPILIATLEFRYGKNLYDDNSSYRAYYCCISSLIKIYYCRCHTWRREGVNNLISFSIRADGLHICYVGHLFFSILKYEVQHIFLGNIVAPMQYISKKMQKITK